ncbi:aminotransferase class V-fold PLP-dependent enzyme [Agrobacterium tumefaciens]|uniref:DegT/DnrJ/EryC1/StrS family aminotransferase n=1 Tax=Agrobacterium cavarae TaxID=2528239 RepID=UPI000DE13BF0|nr:DegT/DnrJ/EryC1/StrS family aminotransferase [Agrobacterium cavarae]MDP9571565.1 perosamine synthetase [Agrobacterium larrymoorei]MQB19687.1 aminotransferase class V-fold PLP-dependent enzyme [Agrobacterium tumefaciens]
MTRIFYTKPSITDLEKKYAADAVDTGWGAKCYDYINRFEALFADYLGVKYAIATSSCTGALQMGLAALGVGKGDEVILADTNWIATAAPIVHLGAEPIFVDILPDTWCLDPAQVEARITPRTKAIVATHIYGNLCDMDALLSISERYKIAVIEDAAEAIGSSIRDRKAGSMGLFGTFSFHGTKTVTTGEGGMFVTNDAELFEKVLTLSNHGRARGQTRQFWPDVIGFKFKMSNVQAAIGCGQIERIEELVGRKREILSLYKDKLGTLSDVFLNPEHTETINGAWMPTVVLSERLGISTKNLQEAFQEADVDARVFFHPLSSLPMFEKHYDNANLYNLNAWSIPQRAINLPSYHDMSSDDIDRVSNVVLDLVSRRR